MTDETYDLNQKETKRWQNVKTQKINIWRWELIEPTCIVILLLGWYYSTPLQRETTNNEYAEGRDLRSDKHTRREGGDANMQHSDHQGRRHLLHVELQTNAV